MRGCTRTRMWWERRICVRPALLSGAASTCLFLFLSSPWFCEEFQILPFPRMVSAAGPNVILGVQAAAAPIAQAAPARTQSQGKSTMATSTAPPAPASTAGNPYHYLSASTLVTPSPVSVRASLCPPGTYPREVHILTGRPASAASGASASAEAATLRASSKPALGVSHGTVPGCVVKPLVLPTSALAGPRSGVLVVPRATSTSVGQPQAPVQRRRSASGAYTALTETQPAGASTGTVIHQQSFQAPRTHKTLCIRRTWAPTHIIESSAQLYPSTWTHVSPLHTYEPVVPLLPTAATVAGLHPHRQGPRTVITSYGAAQPSTYYGAVQATPRYEDAQAPALYGGAQTPASFGATQTPGFGQARPPQEEYRYAEVERRDMKANVRPSARKPTEAEEHERSAWMAAADAVASESHFFKVKPDAIKGTPLALLQMEIDEFCTKRFQALCASRGGRYCTNSPIVGRYGPGGAEDAGGWRCYNKDEMSMDTRSVGCVDQCGSLMRCLGAAGPNTTSIPVPELDEWVLQRKWQHCSPYQQAADALCNFKTSGDLARYDLLRKRWMCLDLDDIAFEGKSFCVDNCGGPIPCVGGLVPGLVPKYTVHIVQHPDMERAFEAIQPCPDLNDVCIATVLNPPRCVKQSTTVLIQRLSAQQERLDEECQEERDDACRRKTLQEECFRLWLARFDIGPRDSSRAWRCYPESVLDFTQISHCADGCGNLVPCRGAPTSHTPLAIDAPRASEIMSDPSYCSAYQRAGNNFCKHKYGDEFVARQHCKTFRWQCLNKEHLPSQGWTGCIGHCGEFISCPAGVDETVEIPNVEDPDLVRAITAVPDPCPVGEQCEPAKQAPPFCSLSRPKAAAAYLDE